MSDEDLDRQKKRAKGSSPTGDDEKSSIAEPTAMSEEPGHPTEGEMGSSPTEDDEEALESLPAAVLIRRLRQSQKEIKELKRAKMNSSFESLLSLKEGDLKLLRWGTGFTHKPSNHLPAQATEAETFTIDGAPTSDGVKKCLTSSRLLMQFVDQENVKTETLAFRSFQYSSEAQIARIVLCAVEDSLKILEHVSPNAFGEREFTVWAERGLFSCRPDIVVVRIGEITLLAIEVKKPIAKVIDQGKTQPTVVSIEKILGHGFDHAQAIQAFGQGEHGFVLLTTFEENALCWTGDKDFPASGTRATGPTCHGSLQSPSRNGDNFRFSQSPRFKTPVASEIPAIAHAVSKDSSQSNTNSSSSPSSPDSSSPSSSSSSADVMQPSPPGSSTSVAAGGMASLDRTEAPTHGTFYNDANERFMHRSKIYKPHDLVPLLCTALQTAMSVLTKPFAINKLRDDVTYKFPKALRVVKDKYWWGKLVAKLGQKIESRNYESAPGKERPNKAGARMDVEDKNAYYMIGLLGWGTTSNVYHALDGEGNQVAIKVYVKSTDDNDVQLEKAEFVKAAVEATETERDLLLKFYPFLEGMVKVEELFGFQCVVMPFFEPVKSNERSGMLGKVESVLRERFHDYKYLDDDIRWRHVGTWGKHCVLYDLADLKKGDKYTEKTIAAHLTELKGRIKIEEVENIKINAEETKDQETNAFQS